MKLIVAVPLVALVISASCEALAWGSKKPQRDAPVKSTPPAPAVPGQYLISFEPSVDAEARAALFKRWGVVELEKVGSTPLYLIQIPASADAAKTLDGLRAASGVRYVEANLKMQTFGP